MFTHERVNEEILSTLQRDCANRAYCITQRVLPLTQILKKVKTIQPPDVTCFQPVWFLPCLVPGVLEWTKHPLLTDLIDEYKTLSFPIIGYGHLPIKQHSLPPHPLYDNLTQI